MSEIKKYCEGLDCAICDEKEPCIYKIANELEEKLLCKEQEYEELKEALNEGCLHNLTLMTEQRVLLQTLAEIKEIAEKLKNFYEELGKCEDLTVVRLKQILQKISECEVE